MYIVEINLSKDGTETIIELIPRNGGKRLKTVLKGNLLSSESMWRVYMAKTKLEEEYKYGTNN